MPPFLLHHGPTPPPDDLTGGVVAIGNFDGVHRGHQALLAVAQEIAQETRPARPVVALTFEPHPRDFFTPLTPVFRLTPLPAKAKLFRALGLSGMAVLPFDSALAQRPAENFVAEILVGQYRPRAVVVGWDFHFGRARGGSPRFLREQGAARGFGVTVVEAFGDEAGETVSSSRIRGALSQGDLALANGLLGYRWFVEGAVVHGDKRGRTLGYPTANLRLPPSCRLAHGIYAVRFAADGQAWDGVASYGRRPTFGGGDILLETHLFDDSPDLYGREATVTFVSRLRPELAFDSAEALVRRMDRDSAEARAALSAAGPGSALDRALVRNDTLPPEDSA